MIKLSVIIRCRNEANTLRLVLESLRHQKCDFSWEVIFVDNESVDDSVAIAKDFGAHIVSIATTEFTYGRALNLGISHAQGEIVMSLSAHSILIGENALTEAIRPFSDPKVAGARCLATDSSGLIRWFSPVDVQKREFHAANQSAIPVIDPHEWNTKVHPNNACAVIRKSVWEEIPFDETLESAEDRHWARQALNAGYKIRHFASCLYQYHRTVTPSLQWQRNQRNLLACYRMGTQPSLSLSQTIYRIVKAPFSASRFGIKTIRNQLYQELALVTYLYKLPRHARHKEKGSKAEFSPSKNTLNHDQYK